MKSNSKFKVLVYPKSSNPYQDLLYNNEAINKSCEVSFLNFNVTHSLLANLIILPFSLLKSRLKGHKLFHIHWLYDFQAPPHKGYIIKTFFTIYVISLLTFTKLLQFKLIYTVHDYIPHAPQFISDIWMTKFIVNIADAVIVQETYTLNKVKEESIHPERIHFVPIGSYIDTYPNNISKEEARKKLGILNNRFVFTFFGRVEYYKGVDLLLKAFNELNLANTDLFIAGPCTNTGYKNDLLKYKSNKNIHYFIEYIDDDDVATYFNAADVVVLPFREITSSSSVLLAFSFKRSVILPNLNELSDLPFNTGFFYEKEKVDGLQKEMVLATSNKKKVYEYGINGYNYSKRNTWSIISEKVNHIYKKISNED